MQLHTADPAALASGFEPLVAEVEDLTLGAGELVGGCDEVNRAVRTAVVVVLDERGQQGNGFVEGARCMRSDRGDLEGLALAFDFAVRLRVIG